MTTPPRQRPARRPPRDAADQTDADANHRQEISLCRMPLFVRLRAKVTRPHQDLTEFGGPNSNAEEPFSPANGITNAVCFSIVKGDTSFGGTRLGHSA